MDIIQPENSLKSSIKFNEIKNIIVERIAKFENLQQYKQDIEFLKLIANMIEFSVKKKYAINKKELLIKIYDQAFVNLTDDDKDNIKKNIEFIFQNNHIKKLSYYKLFCTGIKEFIKKKLF
jgi:hypothetical protein